MDISWLRANPAKIFTNGDWMLSQSRTTSSEWSDLVVLGTAKLWHRKSISWPTTRGEEGINPAPHIHEQMATSNYVQMATTLRTPLRITTSRLSTMR